MRLTTRKFKIFGSFIFLLILAVFIIFCGFLVSNKSLAADSASSVSNHFDNKNQPACCVLHSKTHKIAHEIIQNASTLFSQASAFAAAFAGLFLLAAFATTIFARKISALSAYYAKHGMANFYNYLAQAFSSGILHPKIYNA